MRRSRPGERGAVALIVAVTSALILGVAAFTVDLGMQRVVRSDMQSVADVVALDMARQLGVSSGTPGGSVAASWSVALRSSIERQSKTLGHRPAAPPTSSWTCTVALCAQATPGWVDGDGVFSTTNPGALTSYNAVRVETTASVAFPLHGGSGAATRSAVAKAQPGACFSVGSYAARIKVGENSLLVGPLLKLLGVGSDVTVLDLQGLAGVQLSALDLVDTHVIGGGFDGLLNTDLGLGTFYLALADALEAKSGKTAQVSLLQRLASLSLSGLHLKLSQILDLASGGEAGLDAGVNVLDLVMAGAFAANGANAIDLPDVAVNVPGVSALTASVVVGQRPVEVCGLAGAASGQTSQVSVKLAGTLSGLPLGVLTITAPVSIKLSLAPATATLTSLTCAMQDRALQFAVSSGLLDLDVLLGSTSSPNKLNISALGVPIVNGYLRADGTNAAGSRNETGTVTVSHGDYDDAAPFEAGSGDIGLPALTPDSHLSVLSGLGLLSVAVNAIVGDLANNVVAPLMTWLSGTMLQTVDTGLLSPLLEALGINLVGADVYARPTADCGYPSLAH